MDFYKIYKELFLNEKYKKISAEAKWAYIILLDKLGESKTDEEGNLYLVSIREEIQSLLNLSVNTVTKIFRELVLANLISESKPGFGALKRTYVKKLENTDIIQVHKNSETVISIKKSEILEIKNNQNEIISNKIDDLKNNENLHTSQMLALGNNEIEKKVKEEVILEKTETSINRKIKLIESFTAEDVSDASKELSNTELLRSDKKLNKILDNIEIKSFWGYDSFMISMALEIIVKGEYQDKRAKNIKKLTKHIIETALLRCKDRIRFKHTIAVKVLVDEILNILEETQNS